MIQEQKLSNFLPSMYQKQAEQEGEPLRALLIIFEQLFSGLQKKIDCIDTYFAPFLTPADNNERDFLSWLSSWVVMRLDEKWPEKKKRHFIKNAYQLYTYRGTCKGLKYLIEQIFDITIEIKEWTWPEGMEIGKRSSIGINTRLLEKPDISRSFMVIWRPSPLSMTEKDVLINKIRTILDLEKPAHTKCYFHLEFPEKEKLEVQFMIIGINSTIGLCSIN